MSCITHIRCTSLSLNLTPHLPRMLPIVAVGFFIAIVVPLPAHEFFVRPPGGVHVPPSILGPPFPNLHPKRFKKKQRQKKHKEKEQKNAHLLPYPPFFPNPPKPALAVQYIRRGRFTAQNAAEGNAHDNKRSKQKETNTETRRG